MLRRSLLIGTACACAVAATESYGHAKAPHKAHAPAPTPGPQNLQLVQVQVVFRHGARTPLTKQSHLWAGQKWDVCGSAYEAMPLAFQDLRGGPPPPSPGDEKQRATKLEGGCHKGELTLLGQRQALDLGLWLRRRYIDGLNFLPASYQQGILAARTTNFSRTRATLAGVLRGLYPAHQEPIPVVTSGQMDEVLYADTKACPHLHVLLEASAAMLQARNQEDREQRADLQQQLSSIMQLPEGYWSQRWHFTDLHDALTSLRAHGKPIPEGLTHDMLQQINRLATAEFGAFISPSLKDEHGHVVLRLSMGRMIDKLLANMERAKGSNSSSSSGSTGAAVPAAAATSGSTSGSVWGGPGATPRLICYSGHDSTIMPLLTALGMEVTEWPPYLSNLVFELWEVQPTASPGPTSTSTRRASAASLPAGAAGMHTSSSGSSPSSSPSSSSSSSSSASTTSPGSSSSSSSSQGDSDKYMVRVLYNQEPLQLPGATGPDPTLLPYSTFREGLLQPFLLSEEDHAAACKVPMSHDSALPKPISAASPNDE